MQAETRTATPHALRREENPGGQYDEDYGRREPGFTTLEDRRDVPHGKDHCEEAPRPDAARDASLGDGLAAAQRGASMRVGDGGRFVRAHGCLTLHSVTAQRWLSGASRSAASAAGSQYSS